jgi:NADH:ubiquinone oxidoreductase subunit C
VNGPYIEPNPPRHLVDLLRARFPEAGLASEEFRGEITVTLPAERLVEAARFLRDDPQGAFDLPVACVAVHFLEGEFEHEVMWQIYSLEKNQRLRLKLRLRPGETAPSLTSVWPGTNWTEREQYDLVGVRFTGHPDLRRIIMAEDYPDHPLRKDFDVEGGPTALDAEGRPVSPGFRDMEHA